MNGTTAIVVLLTTIGVICAIITISHATNGEWIRFTIYGLFTVMALGGAMLKPGFDAKRERDQQQAEQQVLTDYPEIRKLIDLDRDWLEITYINERGQRCSTTLVDRDDKWLVNTQTADCDN